MTGANIRNDFPLGLSFHSLQKWSFAIPRQQEKPQKFRTISYLPNWHRINMKSYHSTDLCVVSEFLALPQRSIHKAFTTCQIFLCPVLGAKGLKREKGEHSKIDTC